MSFPRARALLVLGVALALGACREEPRAAPPETPAMPDEKDRVVRTEAEWKRLLGAERYHVLREKGTERPGTGEYEHTTTPGTYVCGGCGLELFASDAKFDSGCGWPAFSAALGKGNVVESHDDSLGMIRTEITCRRCGGHLGHVFDGEHSPTGRRFCVNSLSIDLKPKK